MKTKFSILDVDLEYDFADADEVEKLENSLQEAKIAFENMNNLQGGSAGIRTACRTYQKVFADIFGEDKKNEIFKGKCNFMDCMNAMQELINAEHTGTEQLQAAMNAFRGNQNNPQHMNRKQRRAQMRKQMGVVNANNSAK